MNDSNNMFINWDEQGDNGLLGSLFSGNINSSLKAKSDFGESEGFDQLSSSSWQEVSGFQKADDMPNFCGAYKSEFARTEVRYQDLINDIRMGINGIKGFYFDYRKYSFSSGNVSSVNTLGIPVSSNIGSSNNYFSYKDDNGNEVSDGSFDYVDLNKRICYVGAPRISVTFDETNVKYSIVFPYQGYYDLNMMPNNLKADENYGLPPEYVAIFLTTRKVSDFQGFVRTACSKYSPGLESNIKKSFKEFFSKYGSDASNLKLLYEQIPDFAVLKDDNVLLKHLRLLIDYDINGAFSGWRDSSSAIVKILKNFSDKKKLYDWFYQNPELLLNIYRGLDGDDEENFLGIKISNKEFFCIFLKILSEKYHTVEKTDKAFKIGQSFKVVSNIGDQGIWNIFNWFGDNRKDLTLQQQREVKSSHISYGHGGVSTVVPDSETKDIGDEETFHPLDIVTLEDAESSQTELVPAIYVKMLADKASWAHIIEVATIAGLVATIVFSLGTLTGEAVTTLAAVVAVTDLTAAVVQLVLMEIPDCPEKEWFLKYWEPLSVMIGIGTVSVLLAEGVMKYGPKLMTKITRVKNAIADAAKITELLKKAYAFVEIEIYLAGKMILCSFEPFGATLIKLIGQNFAVKMENMGIFLSKELEDGERLLKFGSYEFKGNLNNIKKILRQAFVEKNIESVFAKLSELTRYAEEYPISKLRSLITAEKAYETLGKIGRDLVQYVDKEVEEILMNLDDDEIWEKVMVSGMAYTKDGEIRIFTKSNFLKEEINLGKGQKFRDFIEKMHPTLRKRFDLHLKSIASKNVLASKDDILRAAWAGSHGEIRALDDLLKEVDPNALLGDEIFNDIVGYNRFLRDGAINIQPPCVHCFYLTKGVKFIGF